MANHPMFAEDMQEIVESFIVETNDILDGLDEDLLLLEQNPADQALIDKIFRAVHTVKGTAGFLSFEQLSYLTHHFESVLNRLRRSELDFRPEMMDVMLHAFDLMKVLVQQVVDQHLSPLDLDPILQRLQAIAEGEPLPDAPAPPPAEAPATDAPAPESADAAASESDESEDTAPALPAAVAEAPRFTEEDLADHPMFAEDMQEIVESFIVETNDILDGLDEDLLLLEQNPADQALIDKIFRAVHTVKGTAGFLSFEQLSYLTHHFESVLNRLRRSELDFRPEMMDVMLHAFDLMKVLVQQVIDQHLAPLDLDPILWQLAAIQDPTVSVPDDLTLPRLTATSDADDALAADDTSDDAAPAPTGAPASTEASAGGEAPAQPTHRRPADRSTETIRVEIERLDSLMNLVGELVLGRNRLLQLISDLDERTDEEDVQRELTDTSAQIDFITTELQAAVMRTRMVQIGRVFKKFPRVVRDLSRDMDKDIALVIEGEETELDKSLIEEISDPLVHLIRNACDHGIERPDDRQAQGKPRQGTVRLAAAHEGNNIVIEIEDDGAGIDAELLKQNAVEKGQISASEAAEMSDTEAYQLIFRAGFSTAKALTSVSGRGVGMDVVKSNIARLNGTISIQSERGQGSRFTLKFPLTLAIIQSLLVRVAQETYAIPLHAVSEVVGLTPPDIKSINGREVIRLREEVLPLLRISEVLQVPQHAEEGSMTYAVVVAAGHQRIGLVVDNLIGQKEIVIKPLGDYLKKVRGIAGSTILGDGRVIMILDIAEAMQLEAARRHARNAPASGTPTLAS